MEHALRQRGQTVGLLFVDLDHFKVVNDSLGHDAGDQLLCDVAQRLAGCVREGDTLARLGGDEFTVLMPNITGAQDAAAMASRIESRLEPPFELPGQSVFVTASIGIATGVALRDRSEALLRDADAAMYEAKARGRARHALFDPTMHTRAVTRLAIETDLCRAIDNDQLELHYQPIMWLQGNKIVGVEALVRWRRPDGTLVPPGEFVPVAEETGLIRPIGRWVLHEACRQLARWRSDLPQAAGLAMSVNISARQLQDASIVEDVESALRETGLDPGSLILELTESAVVETFEEALSTLQQLRWMSVQLAMDDFGTGYSSLTSLSRLPLDILKIDQSFVARLDQDAEGRAVVYAIVSLATALGIRVTGEGIETASQLSALIELDCNHGQGFLLGRPAPPDELAAMLRTVNSTEVTVAARLAGCNEKDEAELLTVAWPAGDPARDHALVLQVGAAEVAAQRRFFVAGDEQVEQDGHGAGVRQQRQRQEQPRLPQDDQERGKVDRVAHPTVGPRRDHPRRCIPGAGSATSHRREVPDAPPIQGRPGRDDGDRLPRGRSGGTPTTRQDPPGNQGSPQPGHHDGEQQIADDEA